jgi:hypothetical protein
MIWGVGTGRCGTRSLAGQLGGLHEPVPRLEEHPVQYKCDINKDVRGLLIERLQERLDLGATAIVDLKHSYVVDLICEVDPDAKFIWMLREPVPCISSLLNGGAFTETDWNGQRKWRPLGGWPKDMSRESKVIAYWIYLNSLIMRSLIVIQNQWQLVLTNSLTVRDNVYPDQSRVQGETLEMVNGRCEEPYRRFMEAGANHMKGIIDL